MDKSIKLLPSQFEQMNQQLKKLEEKITRLNNKNEKIELQVEIDKLKGIINNAVIIENYNENVIEIGTRFEATVNYGNEKETDEYILIQSREGYKDEKNAILAMISTPFGSAVLGRTVGSEFEYNAHGQIFKGVINKIIPNEKVEEKGNQKTK